MKPQEEIDQRSVNRSLRERVAELENRVAQLESRHGAHKYLEARLAQVELGLKALADGAGDPINRRYRKLEEHA